MRVSVLPKPTKMKKILLTLIGFLFIQYLSAQTGLAKADTNKIVSSKQLKLTGYTQPRFQYFTDTAKISGFDIRRARLALTGGLTAKIDYRFFAEFAGGVPPQLLEGIFIYKLKGDQLKFSAGQMLVPLGNDIIASETKMETVNRAILSESLGARGADVIGNQNARDIGIQASGILKTKNDKPYLNYAAGVFNGSGINKFDNNKDKAFAGRVIVSPIQKMWIGGSYYNGSSRWGDSLNVDKNRDRWALEAEYQYKVFTLRAEYMQGVDDTINKGGYYVQLIGDVIPKKIQLSGRFEYFDTNEAIADNAVYVYTICPSFLFGELCKIQIGYDIIREEATVQKTNDVMQVQFQVAF